MCPQHWLEVPAELRGEVELSLVRWLRGGTYPRPYLAARVRAIIHVCQLHQLDVRNLETQLARWTHSTIGTLEGE